MLERIRNLYNLRIQNKKPEPHTYFIRVESGGEGSDLAPEFIVPQPKVRIAGLDDQQVPIFAYLSREAYEGTFPLVFTVADSASGDERTSNARFRGP